ncbi:MAG: SprB repeat-containing protein, partial [Balneolales bacterium]
LNITQGSGNYDISWDNGQSGLSATNLSAGVYTATIEDLGQSNCIKDSTFTLSNPGAPVIDTAVAIAETCLGDNDGIAGIAVSGGMLPYSFAWDNSTSTDSVLFNLSPGTYNVTVSDNNGCEATASMTVDPGLNCCDISLTAAITDPDCGASNGSISVAVQNGSGNYDYTWQPSGSGNNLSNLSAGVYDLTVEDLDQVNCTIDTSITLTGIVNSGITIDTAICANEPIVFNGVVFDSAGTYSYTLQTPSGCDSVINLNISNIQAIGQAPDPNFFNTGNNGSGGILPGGNNDLNWEVAVNDINGPYNPAVVMSSIPGNYYSSPFPDAEWISHSQTGGHGGSLDYFYKIEFELPCMDSCGRSFSDQNAFCLALDFFSDNSVFEIYINGATQSGQIPGIPVGNPYTHTGYAQSGMLSVVLCDNWNPGLNTLILHVASAANFAGFLAQTSVNTPPFVANYDTINTSICETDTITFNGVDIFEPGSYPFELTNTFGCDSNIVLDVEVVSQVFTDIHDTICSGDQFEFNGDFYSQSGVYSDTLQNAGGCDSIVTLYLQTNDLSSAVLIQDANCNTNDGSIEVNTDSSTAVLPLGFSIDGGAF